jgi:DNA-binding transcriptional LysR family regulator
MEAALSGELPDDSRKAHPIPGSIAVTKSAGRSMKRAGLDWESRIGRRFKLRDLYILLTTVQWGSMAKAAAHLGISQPAVSEAIADLEHTFRVRLLDRSSRGVEPTVYGRALIKRGVAAFDELRQGVKEIEFLTDPTAGELRIGTTETMAAGLIPAVIEPLSQQYPAVVFHVTQAPGVAQQYRDLRERNVELILGRMVTPVAEEDLDAEILIDDPLCIVAGNQNHWVGRSGIQLADLVRERWILPHPDSVIGSIVAGAFRDSGLDVPRTAVVSNSLQLENGLLATGRYLGFFPASLIRFSRERLMIAELQVKLPVSPPPVGIVTLKNRTISPVARLFIDCARAVVKPLASASS